MTESETHIQRMQQRLEAIAAREQLLIATLNDALIDADRKLLDKVRNVTIEHEARRSAILSELHGLADRIGAFPVADAPDTIEHEPAVTLDPEPAVTASAPESSARGGDWRTAARRISDDLDLHLKGSFPRYSSN